MNSISENFKSILDKQKGLNYHFPKILRGAATPRDIYKTEKALVLKFNPELKELYFLPTEQISIALLRQDLLG